MHEKHALLWRLLGLAVRWFRSRWRLTCARASGPRPRLCRQHSRAVDDAGHSCQWRKCGEQRPRVGGEASRVRHQEARLLQEKGRTSGRVAGNGRRQARSRHLSSGEREEQTQAAPPASRLICAEIARGARRPPAYLRPFLHFCTSASLSASLAFGSGGNQRKGRPAFILFASGIQWGKRLSGANLYSIAFGGFFLTACRSIKMARGIMKHDDRGGHVEIEQQRAPQFKEEAKRLGEKRRKCVS